MRFLRPMVGGLLGLVLLLCVLPTGASARASSEVAVEASLHYERGEGADRCPDAAAFRRAVAARLGSDPFVRDARIRVEVRLDPEGAAMVARLRFLTPGDRVVGERSLTERKRRCASLVSAAALATALALEPLAQQVVPLPRRDGHGDGVRRVRERLELSAAEPAQPGESPWVLRLGVTGLGHAGMGPTVHGGGALLVGLGGQGWSLDLVVRADAPASQAVDEARIETHVVSGGLSACGHLGWLRACGIGLVGVRRSLGTGLVDGGEVLSPWAAIGVRIGVAIPLTSNLSVVARLDGLVALTHAILRVGETTVWEEPPLAGALSLGLVAEIF